MALTDKSDGDVLTAANWNTIDDELDGRLVAVVPVARWDDLPFTSTSETYINICSWRWGASGKIDIPNRSGSTLYGRLAVIFAPVGLSTTVYVQFYDDDADTELLEMTKPGSDSDRSIHVSEAFEFDPVMNNDYRVRGKTSDSENSITVEAVWLLIYSVAD